MRLAGGHIVDVYDFHSNLRHINPSKIIQHGVKSHKIMIDSTRSISLSINGTNRTRTLKTGPSLER